MIPHIQEINSKTGHRRHKFIDIDVFWLYALLGEYAEEDDYGGAFVPLYVHEFLVVGGHVHVVPFAWLQVFSLLQLHILLLIFPSLLFIIVKYRIQLLIKLITHIRIELHQQIRVF